MFLGHTKEGNARATPYGDFDIEVALGKRRNSTYGS